MEVRFIAWIAVTHDPNGHYLHPVTFKSEAEAVKDARRRSHNGERSAVFACAHVVSFAPHRFAEPEYTL